MTIGDNPENAAVNTEPAGRSFDFRTFRTWAMPVLSLAGIADSAYLTYIHYRGGTYYCAGVGDCDYVNSSSYASVAGIPVALLGLVIYGALFAASITAARASGPLGLNVAPAAIFGLSLTGVLASAYFTYVELFILHAI